MDLGSLFLVLALFLLVAVFVSRPLLERRSLAVSEQEHDVSALLAERDRILNALAELDFDHELGKVPEEIYPAQRANLLRRGADMLRRLDQYQPDGSGQGADDRLEAAIAARKGAAAPAGSGDELEAMIAARRAEREQGGARYCHNCGSPVQAGDRFCTNCGAAL